MNAPPPRIPRKRVSLRRILRLLVILLVLVGAFVALAPWLLERHAERALIAALEDRFDAEVTLERFDLSWGGGVAFEGLSVQRAGEAEPMLSVERARFAPALLALWGGTFRLEGTLLEDVVVRLRRREGRFPSFQKRRRESSEAAGSAEIRIEGLSLALDVAIEGVRVEVHDEAWPAPAIYDLRAPVRLRSTGPRALEFRAEPLPSVELAVGLELPVGQSVRLDRDLAAFLHFDARDAELSALEPVLAPWLEGIEGRWTGSGAFRLEPGGALSGDGDAVVEGLVVARRDASDPFAPAGDQVLAAALHGRVTAGEFVTTWLHGKARSEFGFAFAEDVPGRWTAEASWPGDAVADLLPAASSLAWEGSPLRWRAEAVAGADPNDYDLHASLETAGTTLYLGSAGRPLLGPGTLEFRGRWIGGRAGAPGRLSGGTIDLPGARVLLARANAQELSGSAALDLDEFTVAWLESFGIGVRAAGPGALSFDLRRDAEDPSDWTGSCTLDASRIALGGVDAQRLRAALELGAGGAMSLTEGRVEVNGGLAEFGFELPAREASGAGEQRPFQARLHASEVEVLPDLTTDLARVLPLLAGPGARLEGRIGLELQVRGDAADPAALARSLSGRGSLLLGTGRIVPSTALAAPLAKVGLDLSLPMTSSQLPFEVDAGAVALDGVRFRRGDLELALVGRTSLEGELKHELTLKVRDPAWQRFAVLLDQEGLLRLPLRGTLEAPRLEMPDVEELLRRAAQQTLERSLEQGVRTGDWGSVLGGILDRIGGGNEQKQPKDGKRPKKNRDGEEH